jgi:hypothetical protein
MKLELSSKHKAAIEAGRVKRNRLIRAAKMAAAGLTDEKGNPIQYYIYGPSGIGKTYWSEKAVKDAGVIHTTISGNTSMMAFAINLAVIKHMFPEQKVVIIVDDCDEILKDANAINQMKELLEKHTMSYNKRFHINTVGDEESIEHQAILECMTDGQQGFTVNCSNFTFIITSNIRLAYDDDAEKIVDKNGGLDNAKSIRSRHLAAIRGRCDVKDLDMSFEEKWGNLALVTLEDEGCNDCNEQQKVFILNYIWNNWDNMKETSIRTVNKMARILKFEGEEGIMDAFDAEFLK